MDSIILDNGTEYLILKNKKIGNTTYTLFINPNDEEDICFRKRKIENGKEYFASLDNDEELIKVLSAFNKIKL